MIKGSIFNLFPYLEKEHAFKAPIFYSVGSGFLMACVAAIFKLLSGVSTY
jgi:hypothetical protein